MSQEAQEKFNSFYNTEGVSSQLQLFTQTEFFSLIEIETNCINFCIDKNLMWLFPPVSPSEEVWFCFKNKLVMILIVFIIMLHSNDPQSAIRKIPSFLLSCLTNSKPDRPSLNFNPLCRWAGVHVCPDKINDSDPQVHQATFLKIITLHNNEIN